MIDGYEWTREALDKLIFDGVVDRLQGDVMRRLLAPERETVTIEIPCRPPFRRSGRSVIVSLEVIRASGFRGRARALPGGDRAVVFASGRRSRRAALRKLFPMWSRAIRDSRPFEAKCYRAIVPISVEMVMVGNPPAVSIGFTAIEKGRS